MPNTPPNLIAGDSIYPSRFVKPSTAADFEVLAGTDNAQCLGISQDGTNYAPLSDQTVSAYAATVGQNIEIYGDGDTCLLEAGATITRGDRLSSDSVGRGTKIETTGTVIQQIGALALQSGIVGDLVRVQVIAMRSERPALS